MPKVHSFSRWHFRKTESDFNLVATAITRVSGFNEVMKEKMLKIVKATHTHTHTLAICKSFSEGSPEAKSTVISGVVHRHDPTVRVARHAGEFHHLGLGAQRRTGAGAGLATRIDGVEQGHATGRPSTSANSRRAW